MFSVSDVPWHGEVIRSEAGCGSEPPASFANNCPTYLFMYVPWSHSGKTSMRKIFSFLRASRFPFQFHFSLSINPPGVYSGLSFHSSAADDPSVVNENPFSLKGQRLDLLSYGRPAFHVPLSTTIRALTGPQRYSKILSNGRMKNDGSRQAFPV